MLIFKVDANKFNKNAHTAWHKSDNWNKEREQTLWNGQEHIYFGKIQALDKDIHLNVSHYERVIDEIKTYVTTRLSEIAINEADLVHQLK